jgi:hypothetical protein
VKRLLLHAARAFGPVPLIFVAFATVGLALAVRAGLLGLPLLAILASWTAKYWFVLLESSAHGLPPPVLSIESVNPFDEWRPLAVLLMVAIVVALLQLAQPFVGRGATWALGALALALSPASFALLAVEGSLVRAMNPAACFGIARVLGRSYLVLVVAAIAIAAIAGALEHAGAPLVVVTASGLLLALSYATLVGGALHEHRLELGLEAIAAPERDVERDAAQRRREFDLAAEEVYGLVRARQLEAAWRTVERWLAAHRDPDDWAALLERTERWEDARIADRLRRELVARLLSAGRRGDALLAVEAAWRRGFRYAPGAAAELVALIRLATDMGHDATAERLLADCAGAFPADPEVHTLVERRRG